jgi:hypothetical protein
MKKLGQTYTNCEKEFMENLQYMNRMNLDGLVYAMSKNKRNIVSKQDAKALRQAIKSIKKVKREYMGF